MTVFRWMAMLMVMGAAMVECSPSETPRDNSPETARGSAEGSAAPLPKDIDPDSMSRLPLIKREDLDEHGKRVYDSFVDPKTRSLAGLRGPLGLWLYSPRLGEYMHLANRYLRYETDLGPRLTELAILVTARELDSQFEWTMHEPAALKAGLEPEIIDIVKYRKSITGLGEKEALIIRFGRELIGGRKLGPETFARAVATFGRQGVVNLSALMGNYASTAILLNAVDLHLRPDQKPLLPIP